jgi:hypothetical protein
VIGPQHLLAVSQIDGLERLFAGMGQSCVITTLAKLLAILLITGTTCSPSLTARLPPGRKQFWTSITSSADASSGLIGVAAPTRADITVAIVVMPRPPRIRLRSNMVHLPARNLRQQIKSPGERKAGLTGVERSNLRQPNIG